MLFLLLFVELLCRCLLGALNLGSRRCCFVLHPRHRPLGASQEEAGDNARDLARLTAAVVLAGEISLMSALASNHLVSAHMKLNR